MSVVDALVALVATAFWVTTGAKVAEVRRSPTPAQMVLVLTLGALAWTATLLLPAVHVGVGRFSGVSNLAEPLARTGVLGAACGAQSLLLVLTRGTGQRGPIVGRVVVLLAVVTAMWVLFAAAPVEAPTLRFTSRYGDEPLVVAYLGVCLAYLAVALVDVGRGARRYAAAGSGRLAVGLHLIAWGCFAGLAYVAWKAVALAALASSDPFPVEVEATLGRVLAVLAGSLVVAGATLPAAGRRVEQTAAWVRAYRQHWRLYRLWHDLVSVHPELALDPARSALRDRLRVRDLDLLLYRRVIELRDGRLALRDYLDADVRDLARDHARVGDAPDGKARGEAQMLSAAITAARADRLPRRSSVGSDIEGGDLAAELSWLLQVAREYGRGRQRPLERESGKPAGTRARTL